MSSHLLGETTFHSSCWEVHYDHDDVESLLARLRSRSPNALIQIFSSTKAPNPATIEMIAAQTLSARESGTLLADRPEVDLILRVAATSQIGEAFKRYGYKTKGRRLFLVVAVVGDSPDPLEKKIDDDKECKRLTPKELSQEDLERVEKAALLAVRA